MFRAYTSLIVVAALVVLSGCSGVKRGIDGASFVSTARPAYSVDVPSLPLRTGGQIMPSVTTEQSLGGVPVQAWIAVYGGKTPQEPMAIVSQAITPDNYYWDSDLIRIFSINSGVATIGEFGFQTCTYIVNGANDAFSALVATDDPDALRWIVRRFAVRTNFDQTKITLEYREQLPESIVTLTDLPQGARTLVREFEERAERAFVFGPVPATAVAIRNTYPEGVRTRFLNTNFFGTMSAYQYFD